MFGPMQHFFEVFLPTFFATFLVKHIEWQNQNIGKKTQLKKGCMRWIIFIQLRP
jgi:hypothetical protein